MVHKFPPIQVVDENDEPIGSAGYDELHEKGLYHRIVYMMVEDEQGNILLQMRGPNVGTHPNCWDVSAAGHVDIGEDYDIAAERELSEELGVTAQRLTEIGYYKSQGKYQHRILNRFNKVYKVIIPRGTVIDAEASEVTETKWFSIQEIRQLMQDHPDQVADGLVEAMERYYP